MFENQVQGDIGSLMAWVILAVVLIGGVVIWRRRNRKR